MAVEWDKTELRELDITATELSSDCLANLLVRCPPLRYLSAGQQDGFNDDVMRVYMEKGNVKQLIALDIDRNENISEDMIMSVIKQIGPNLRGLQMSGIPNFGEQFWPNAMPYLKNLRYQLEQFTNC